MASKPRRRFTAEYKTEAVARLSTPGATLTSVAKELGISATQLKSWWLEREAAGSATALARQQAEAAELQHLRRENRRLQEENEILRKASAFFAQWAGKPWPRGSPSSPPTAPSIPFAGCAPSSASPGRDFTLGGTRPTDGPRAPRVRAALMAQGWRVSRRRVATLMKENSLRPDRQRQRPPITTDSRHSHAIAPNRLGPRFNIDRPDAVWLADISDIPTDEGWLYVAAIKDMATREIVGWSMSDRLKSTICEDALTMAIMNRNPKPGLIHHSDRGVRGGFKRSSQHFDRGGCDEHSKAAI